MADRLTEAQGIILSGFTGFLCCKFAALQADVEKRLGRPVWTHEFATPEMRDCVKELYRDDFMAMLPDMGAHGIERARTPGETE